MDKKIAFSILHINRRFTEPCLTVKDFHKCIERYYLNDNPAASYMVSLIFEAYQTVKDYVGAVELLGINSYLCYGAQINTALNAIIPLNLEIEVRGAWIWVTGATNNYRQALLDAGFSFALKKQLWYYSPEKTKHNHDKYWTVEQIRARFGSRKLKSEEQLNCCLSQ